MLCICHRINQFYGEINMAKAPKMKKKTVAKRATTKKVAVEKSVMKKRGRPTSVAQAEPARKQVAETQKNAFEEKFGEGTAFDLDYGKLLIIGLCAYIAVQVS
jgi:hypothetical protein